AFVSAAEGETLFVAGGGSASVALSAGDGGGSGAEALSLGGASTAPALDAAALATRPCCSAGRDTRARTPRMPTTRPATPVIPATRRTDRRRAAGRGTPAGSSVGGPGVGRASAAALGGSASEAPPWLT